MKAIILAAGEGSRLGEISKDIPKCLVEIEDNTLLEIQINTLHACGIEDICVVRGYQGNKISIPGLKYYNNSSYADTGILESLFCARAELNDEVLILYSDILYEPQIVKRLIESSQDICAAVMVNWAESLKQRPKVALQELEMVYFDSENLIRKTGKKLTEPQETQGQFAGMIKCSKHGAEILKKNYERLKQYSAAKKDLNDFANLPITGLFQEMADLGVPLHCVMIERGWLEIDTPQDYQRAITDTNFVRHIVQKKTDWSVRAELYNGLDWVQRDELLSTMVETAAPLDAKSRVLDLGTGTGKILMALKQKYKDCDYYGIDFSPEMLSKIDSSYNFKLSVSTIEDLKDFSDNSFDLVTARMVFHHANDINRAMKEVFRVLKPAGRFILCEGNPPDADSVSFYKNMFRFKEDRLTFLTDDMINLLTNNGLDKVCTKTIIMKGMSLNNWLDKSGLPFRNIDIIKKMHRQCEDTVQQAYNMKFTDEDILMDWKFSVVYGTKQF